MAIAGLRLKRPWLPWARARAPQSWRPRDFRSSVLRRELELCDTLDGVSMATRMRMKRIVIAASLNSSLAAMAANRKIMKLRMDPLGGFQVKYIFKKWKGRDQFWNVKKKKVSWILFNGFKSALAIFSDVNQAHERSPFSITIILNEIKNNSCNSELGLD